MPKPLGRTAPAIDRPLSTIGEAQSALLGGVRVPAVEIVTVAEALGRVLAEDVITPRALPPTDNSAMDGFAVRADDVSSRGPLIVHGESRAGRAPTGLLDSGYAMPISTGASLPAGSDAIVPIEQTERDGAKVLIRGPVRRGDFVRARGGDLPEDAVVMARGSRVRGSDLAALAATGCAAIAVAAQPRVGILASGDELVPAGAALQSLDTVVDCNSPMLAAAVRETGGVPISLGIARDNPEDIHRRITDAAQRVDVIVCSAGVSVGEHDHIVDVVAGAGSVDLWRVAMRPGKPLLIGSVQGTTVLGLPGNPVSAAVTFEIFGRPLLLSLQGASTVQRPTIAVRLAEDVMGAKGLTSFLRISLSEGDEPIPLARLTGSQGSSLVHSLVRANALLIVPGETACLRAGTVAAAIPIP